MKRSLFIAIVVLLMAALFVSCNAEKSMEDQLVEVTIDGGARALSAAGTMDIDVEGLYWYYTAEKTSGYFREGQKTSLTAIVGTGTDGKGIATASLGSMSTGGWKFCFYGFTARPENPASMTKEQAKAAAILYQADLKKVITETIALSVSLSRGEGALADPVAVFADGLFWKDKDGVFAQSLDGTLSLVITNNDEVVKIYQTETVSEGKAVFNPISDITLEVGPNELVFEVYYSFEDDGVDLEEKLGYYPLTISAESGMTYTIASDSNGIPFYAGDTQVAVTINGATAPVVTNNAIVASTTQGMSKVEAANTPAAGGTEVKTTVEFPIDLTGKQLTVETSSAEVASAKAFAVSTDSAVVGSISLSISDGTTTFGTGNTATISTFIGKNLGNDDDIEVHYAGTDAADVDQNTVHYDPATGYVTFETSHFSEFYVTAKGEAKIGSKVYNTLVEAVADAQSGATINLLKDANGAGIFLGTADAKTITIDLGTHTYTCSGPAVGSAGTATQALHLEMGNTVTVKNGKITSTATSGVKMLVQNYCNLTLEDVILDGANIGNGQYTLSNNCGVINIIGATSIYAPANGRAFDVCAYASYSAGVTVNVATTGTISGIVEIDANKPYPLALNISRGTFEGSFRATANTTDEEMRSIINITGGTFNGKEPVAFVNNAVYGSLMEAIDSVDTNATATIVLLKDVADGSGLSTDSRNADSYPKNLTIDFNGKTYTMKDPSVGSTGTKTQAMHWAAGSTIVLKNGTFAVQADAVNVKMGMQNYANLTIENMQIDLRSVQKTFYEEDLYQAYPDYYMKEVPIFNVSNLNASLLLKDSTVLVADAISWAVLADGPLTIDNCNLKKVAIGDGTVTVSNGEYVIVSYFDNKEVAQNGNVYSLVAATN